MSFFLLPYLIHSVGAIILLTPGNLIARFLAPFSSEPSMPSF
jgi:hypothetical protein